MTLFFVLVLLTAVYYFGWKRGVNSREGRNAPPGLVSHSGSSLTRITEITSAEEDSLNQEPAEDDVIVIRHVVEPYWQELGWQPDGNRLNGFYRTPGGSFEGYVLDWRSRSPRFYIIRPPRELKKHPHWACFRPRGNGLYWVHFARTPPGPDPGIIEIEKVLGEALSSRQGRKS